MRSLIYLFAILTGLTAPSAAQPHMAVPVAVNAAQALSAAEQQEQMAPATIYAALYQCRALALNIRAQCYTDTPSALYQPTIFRSDRARE